jgi:hypothetical protein
MGAAPERMTARQYLAQQHGTTGTTKTGKNKYGAKKTVLDGITFHSKSEAERYSELVQMQAGRLIFDLKLQVKFPLLGANGPMLGESGRPLFYKADFVYFEDGQRIVEDRKGKKTADYLLKKSNLAAQGIEIRET